MIGHILIGGSYADIVQPGVAGLGGAPCIVIPAMERRDIEVVHLVAIGGETQSFQQQDLLPIHPYFHLSVIGVAIRVDLDTFRYVVPFAPFEEHRRAVRIDKIVVLPVFVRLIHVVEIEHGFATSPPHQTGGESVRSVAQIASGAACAATQTGQFATIAGGAP